MTAATAATPSVAAPGAPPPTTSALPTANALWRRQRGLVLGVLVLVVASVGYAYLRGSGSGATLDPRSYSPGGARAVATLLADRGVPVQVVVDLPALRAARGTGSTVLVPLPFELTDDELGQLSGLGLPVVLLGAEQAELDAAGLPATAGGVAETVLQPACDLPAATVAGPARTGGVAYAARSGVASVGCYARGGDPTVLVLPRQRTTLVGAAAPFTNDRLAQDGNAALALGLLGSGDRVLWLLPDPGRAVPGGQRSVRDLLPDGVLLGALQLAVAVVLLALWRARRLGRVVAEPLPVVVRAAEAVEGRGRLYRAAGARDAAGGALRAGRDPREIDGLLYGPPPPDDATLVRLADALDGLAP